MAKPDWALIESLASALGTSNTPKTIPKAIGRSLAPRWDAQHVRLTVDQDGRARAFEAERSGERWVSRSVDVPAVPAATTSLAREGRTRTLTLALQLGEVAGQLVIHFGPRGQPIVDDPDYLQTLARIVEVGIGYQRLILRVAGLSRQAHVENRELRESLDPGDELVSRSPQMRAVVARIAMVARYDTAVLVRGESGVGKELAARMIHRRSPRSRGPFVQINCGAIPAPLVASELFGHERGAFTGAARAHRGVFEQADGGVLFLDEVGDLPLDAQVQLLRVLQEGRVRRVGAEAETRVDVRVVAATNRPLDDMLQTGQFREDLFYRLNVFPIHIPPLRERPEDLPVLVHSLLDQLSARLGVSRPSVSKTVMAKLRAHDWPGNVRELANVLEAATILGGGRSLELPADFRHSRRPASAMAAPVTSFETAVRSAIETALRASSGKIYGDDGAAAALDLHPATLQSKMRKLGIRRDSFTS